MFYTGSTDLPVRDPQGSSKGTITLVALAYSSSDAKPPVMLDTLAWIIALPPALALTVFSVEVLLGLRPLRNRELEQRSITAAILIPAHNEAASIGTTVRLLVESVAPGVKVLVVADNCTDDTARLAAHAGADVVERCEPERRGKGFALAYGRDRLALDPPDVVLVLDADCQMDPTSVRCLVTAASELQAPVQARNLLVAPPSAPPLVQISNFAMLIKNLIRARGLYRVGGGIPLFGTGMAFPWKAFQQANLATADTVEDLRLALDLAREGTAVHLIEQAHVLSAAAAADDTIGQRRRWEHGFLRTALRQAAPLIGNGLLQLSRHQIALGLHLCVPPLALLLVAASMSALVVAGIALATGTWEPAVLLACLLLLALGLTLVAWWKEGRSTLSPAALARTPWYIAQKLPIYLGLLNSHPAEWNRTRRSDERP